MTWGPSFGSDSPPNTRGWIEVYLVLLLCLAFWLVVFWRVWVWWFAKRTLAAAIVTGAAIILVR